MRSASGCGRPGTTSKVGWTLRQDRTSGGLNYQTEHLGVSGCIVLAITLPLTSALAGAGVRIIGAGIWVIRRTGQRATTKDV
jgi:hypothetical protein